MPSFAPPPLRNAVSLSAASPFPVAYRCEMKYADIGTLATGAAGVGGTEVTWRLNSLFDPDLTAAGHQPFGYDRFNVLYARYKVTACDVDFQFNTPGSAADMLCMAAVRTPNNGGSLTAVAPSLAIESPNIWTGQLSSTGERRAVFRQRFDIGQVLGLTRSQFESNIEDYSALVGANPARVPTISFAVASYSGEAAQTCAYMICLTYHVVLWDRIGQGQS